MMPDRQNKVKQQVDLMRMDMRRLSDAVSEHMDRADAAERRVRELERDVRHLRAERDALSEAYDELEARES